MSNWYFKKSDLVLGPLTDAGLKTLANSGDIRPDTFVRLEDTGQWVLARKVKKLFTEAQLAEIAVEVTPPVQIVELTAKKYKAMQLAGFAVALFGGFLFLPGIGYSNGILVAIGAVALLGGIAVNWLGRGMAWWNHG